MSGKRVSVTIDPRALVLHPDESLHPENARLRAKIIEEGRDPTVAEFAEAYARDWVGGLGTGVPQGINRIRW